jgi:diadenosine tetraphosphate (Ap4A) HIT family hydrolase
MVESHVEKQEDFRFGDKMIPA